MPLLAIPMVLLLVATALAAVGLRHRRRGARGRVERFARAAQARRRRDFFGDHLIKAEDMLLPAPRAEAPAREVPERLVAPEAAIRTRVASQRSDAQPLRGDAPTAAPLPTVAPPRAA